MKSRDRWWPALLIAALALAASANSIANGFALDDVYLLVMLARTHTLAGWWREFAHTYWPEAWGGDGYRPLTSIFWRLEWALGGGKPFVFHTVNVVLHTLGAVAVFGLARGVLPLAAAWVAAALYAVHPVHVEAIANVVGQSELWVALLVVLAVGLYVHGRLAGPMSWKQWVVIGSLYSAAVLFKEHAVVLPALLLLAEISVVPDGAPLRPRLTRMRLPLLALAVVAVSYLWVRNAIVVHGLAGFRPHIVFDALDLSWANRLLTMVGVAPEWLRLFLWPARLMTEYSPPYIDVAQGPSVTQLPGLLVLVGTLGLIVACWRRSPATAFGLAWLVLTLLPASNFVVPAGFIIAERTLLLPSVGAMIAVGSVVPWLYSTVERKRATQYAVAAALAVVLFLATWRSVTRNRVWTDNDTLLRQSIVDSPDSYRAHFVLGNHLFGQKKEIEAETHYRRAMQLFPYDPGVTYDMAERYRRAGMCDPAITYYRWLFTLKPDFYRGRIGLASCLLQTLQLDEAREQALRSIGTGAKLKDARSIIRTAREARDSIAARRARGTTTLPLIP